MIPGSRQISQVVSIDGKARTDSPLRTQDIEHLRSLVVLALETMSLITDD